MKIAAIYGYIEEYLEKANISIQNIISLLCQTGDYKQHEPWNINWTRGIETPKACPALLLAHRRLIFAHELRNRVAEEWSHMHYSQMNCAFLCDHRMNENISEGDQVHMYQNSFCSNIILWHWIPRQFICKCLVNQVIPFGQFVLMQDNDKPHVAQFLRQYLDEMNI